MLILWFLSIKSLPNLLFGVLCLPRDQSHPVCATVNKPSWVLHLLDWFIGSRGFSSLERRPEFWVLQEYMLPHQFREDAPYQLRSSYRMRMMPLSLGNMVLLKEVGNERVTGRKARGLQTENRLQGLRHFCLSLKWQEETNSQGKVFLKLC